MHTDWFVFLKLLAFVMMLVGCTDETSNPVHRVNHKLLGNSSVLSDRIREATSYHIETLQALNTCEKYAKNAPIQCWEHKVTLARAAASLCGLETERAMLYKIMENGGDARGVSIVLGEYCEPA